MKLGFFTFIGKYNVFCDVEKLPWIGAGTPLHGWLRCSQRCAPLREEREETPGNFMTPCKRYRPKVFILFLKS